MKYEQNTHDEFYFDYIRLLVENRMLFRCGYYLGASNNFVRLFTLTARRYWLAQATCEHLTADWKIHFSIRPRDLSRAFNLLAELYYEMKLPFGIKARYPDYWKDYENVWPKHMRGREITVYIFLYESSTTPKQTMLYSKDNMKEGKYLMDWELTSKDDIYFSHDISKDDQIPLERYWEFTVRAEDLLKRICVTLPIHISATDVLPIGIESMTFCQLTKPPSDTLPTMRLFANWQNDAKLQDI